MLRTRTFRRGIAALALVSLLLPAPGVVRAEAETDPVGAAPTSVVGALMGAACGAGISVARAAPLPIVVVVAAASCALMLLDAWTTPDPK